MFSVREEALEVNYSDRSRPIMTWFWSPTGVLAACHETVRYPDATSNCFWLLHKTTTTLLTTFVFDCGPSDRFLLFAVCSFPARVKNCSLLHSFQRIDRAIPKSCAGSSQSFLIPTTNRKFLELATVLLALQFQPIKATIQIVESVPTNFQFDLNFNCSNTLFIYCSLVL